jgi:hypothetical protein
VGTVFTSEFYQARISAITAQITAIETAITGLSSGTLRSYTLNTGQTTQTVTKQEIGVLRIELDKLISRLRYWDDLLNGGGTILARHG